MFREALCHPTQVPNWPPSSTTGSSTNIDRRSNADHLLRFADTNSQTQTTKSDDLFFAYSSRPRRLHGFQNGPEPEIGTDSFGEELSRHPLESTLSPYSRHLRVTFILRRERTYWSTLGEGKITSATFVLTRMLCLCVSSSGATKDFCRPSFCHSWMKSSNLSRVFG